MTGPGEHPGAGAPGASGSRAFHAYAGVCVLLLLADLVLHRHVEHALEGWFGFYAFYGFVACVTLVLVARGLRRVLMRREDYYDAR
jgi:Na+/melibiose symporter-like transporter